MLRKTAIAQAVSLAFATLAFAQSAQAQDAASSTIQRVEITGSSIKRASAETASPVQVITRDELAKSGKGTVAEYLQTLTADGAGSLPTSFGNGFAAGSTAISLRGLGATSTLVLLNGRRMAPFARADDGQKTFTDISTIPMEAVERIEVLKDGASSTYGADAIAGVVNIILRKDFTGLVAKLTVGESRYRDGETGKTSLTWGKGNLDSDGFNIMVNAELYKNNELLNKDRASRDWIGHADLRQWGYPLATQFASGNIIGNNNANNSPTGSIRNPTTLDYTSLPGCENLSVSKPQDPKGGCLWHQDQFRSMQPQIDGFNLYSRGALNINADLQAYAEVGYSKRDTSFTLTPPSITGAFAFPPTAQYPTGVVNWTSGAGTTMVLGATHPQNPYGVPVRVKYTAFDIGPSTRSVDNAFNRIVLGLKGSYMGWDFDTAYLHSESKLDLAYSNMLNMPVLLAALSDPKSPNFPYYIGAQANKNPASLYAAITRTATSHSTTKLDMVDFKASRELMQLPGGPLGVAVGAEYRKEKLDNPSLSGSSDGSINSNYVAAKGDETIGALFVELAAPVIKSVELSGALRYDHYSSFKSTTPKIGVKWTPVKTFALRGTYSEGFRAPGPAESSATSQSAGSASVADPVRCPGGKPAAGAAATDCAASFAGVKIGNPNLRPETSKGATLGMVWDPFNGTSMSIDAWQIKRSDEINVTNLSDSVLLPGVLRADNNLVSASGAVIPNSGTILMVQSPYRNSSYTKVKGLDLDVKQKIALGEYGRLVVGMNWSHVASWLRADSATSIVQYAGTHGNCDTSNCIGTPKDKISMNASWDLGAWNMTATANYRSDMKNTYTAADTVCASSLANGSPAPNARCVLPSFTTIDLSGRYNYSKSIQLFASVSNLFDKVAPLDPLTYGSMSYNPLDYSGAIGRYFKAGARFQF
ncbi:MAG: TonB-dependent receptor [Pseudomonadota bacterium]